MATSTTSNVIIVNAITRAIDAMVNPSITFDKACDTVRAFRASGKLEDKTAREYFQAALQAKVPAYKAQLTDKGYPTQGSAFQRAVSRLMKATAPEQAASVKEELAVPADIQALFNKAWALCSQYEAAGKLAATAMAIAKAK